MSKVSIFIVNRIDCKSYNPENWEIFKPIYCGSKYTNKNDLLRDDINDNISYLRMNFCELTVLYWSWKNCQDEYIGLFHYRRYLNFENKLFEEDSYGNVIENKLNSDSLSKFGLNSDMVLNNIIKYDLILPTKRNVSNFPEKFKSMLDHWTTFYDIRFVNILREVMMDIHKEDLSYLDNYWKGNTSYFCCLFVASKKISDQLCEWLFPILFELKNRIDLASLPVREERIIGMLGERLISVFFEKLIHENPSLRFVEKQSILFLKPNIESIEVKHGYKPVVYSVNDEFFPSLLASLVSLRENNLQENLQINVLYSRLSEENLTKLRLMSRSNFNVVLQRITEFDSLIETDRITKETYFRFLIPYLLPASDKVLYLDTDTIITTSVKELFSINLGTNFVGAAKDLDFISNCFSSKDLQDYSNNKLNLRDSAQYFQAGVLIFNSRRIREEFTLETFLAEIDNNYKYKDQDILNKLFQGKVYYLDQKWNYLADCSGLRHELIKDKCPAYLFHEYELAKKEPLIIHYAGFAKPWLTDNVEFKEFYQYFYSLGSIGLTQDVNKASKNFREHLKKSLINSNLTILLKSKLPRPIYNYLKKVYFSIFNN